jgi:uncharacterized protein YdhG (YjbR/CyaY superfamily)
MTRSAPATTPALDGAKTIDAYIAAFPPEVGAILQRIREVIQSAAPAAREVISYRMPAFRQHGVLLYFAAFKHHIGLYPPIAGDAALERALARYAGEKGSLRFPLDQPIPYQLIARCAKLRAAQDSAKKAAREKAARAKPANDPAVKKRAR